MIRIQQLKKNYGDKIVLKEISFNLTQRNIYGLVGENGSGKTTLFECIKNLTKYQGEIEIDQSISIGYLPTSLYFYPNMKGYEYIEFCLSARKISPKRDMINEMNQIFDLPLSEYAANYSTGMKKKLAFMALLMQKNDFLLLDEPFNGLDLSSCLIFKRILLNLKERKEKTVFLSSHIISSLTDISDLIFHLSNGEIKRIYEKLDFGEIEDEIINSTLRPKLDCINNILI